MPVNGKKVESLGEARTSLSSLTASKEKIIASNWATTEKAIGVLTVLGGNHLHRGNEIKVVKPCMSSGGHKEIDSPGARARFGGWIEPWLPTPATYGSGRLRGDDVGADEGARGTTGCPCAEAHVR